MSDDLLDQLVERLAAAVGPRVGELVVAALDARADGDTPAGDARRGDELLTIAEAAERARCSPKTVRRAVDSGDLRALRPGHRLLFHGSDLRAWLDSTAVAPAQTPPAARRRAQPRAPRGAAGSLEVLREMERRARPDREAP